MQTKRLLSYRVALLAAAWFAGIGGAPALTISWTNHSSGDWNVASNWSPNQAPGASDTATISSQTITVTVPVTVSNLTLTGGILAGASPVTVLNNLNWTAGTISGVVLSQGTLSINGSGTPTVSGLLVNQGQATWTGGTLRIGGGGVLSNAPAGTFTIGFNGTGQNTPSGAATFANAGLLLKNGTTGTASLVFTLNNTGMIQAQLGTLSFTQGGTSSGTFSLSAGGTVSLSGGTFSLQPGTIVSGAGTFQVANNGIVNLSGNYVVTNGTVGISSGTLTFNSPGVAAIANLNLTGGTLAGASPVTVLDNLGWTAGTVSGVVFSQGTLSISGSGTPTVSGGLLVNQGQATWTGGTLRIGGGGVLSNAPAGTFTIGFNGTGQNTPSGAATFANAGLLLKNGTTGTASLDFTLNNIGTIQAQLGTLSFTQGGTSSGTFSLSTGGTVSLSGGTFNLQPGTIVSGAGTFQVANNGIVNLSGNYVLTNGTVGISSGTLTFNSPGVATIDNLNLTGGTLAGASPVTVLDNLGWTAGTISGWVLSQGTLSISGSGTPTVSGGLLVNQGQATWTGGTLRIGAGGVLSNAPAGTFTIGFNGNTQNTPSGAATFANAGLLLRNGTTGTASLDFAVSNQGQVEIQEGTLNLSGTYVQTSGRTLLDGGNIVNGSTLVIQGGSLEGSGSINGSVVVASGATLSAGTSLGTLAISQSLTLQPGSTTIVPVNAATAAHGTIQDGSSITFGGNLMVTNLTGLPVVGQSFQVFNTPAHSGNFSTLAQSPGPGLRWRFDPALGTVSVVSAYSQPVGTVSYPSGNHILVQISNGPPGTTNYLVGSTNVAQPLATWARLGTNIFDVSGNCTFTNTLDPATPRKFYGISFPAPPF